MADAYLFDFDGTLVDSMPTFVSEMRRILDDNRIPYEKDLMKTIIPLGLNGTAEYYIHTLGLRMAKEQLIGLMKEYMLEAYFHTIPAKLHVEETLRELKRRGRRLYVLTASPHVTLDACLKRLRLWDLFEEVWSCDDFHTTKADPAIYGQAAARMGAAVEEVLFLDDNLDADITAKAAGMQVCGVYDASAADYADRIRAVADYYITDFAELLTIDDTKKA